MRINIKIVLMYKYEKNLINSIHFLKNKAKKLEDIYHNAKYIIQ